MSDTSQFNELQPKKKKKKSVLGYVIAIVFLSIITLASLGVAYQSVKLYKDEVKKNEETVVEVTYTQEEVDEMVKLAREDAAEQATAGFYAELKDTAENSNGIVSMLRKMYPEYFVYYNNNHYEFVEIDHTIPQANFENENIIASEGFLEYKVDGETQSVKGIDVSKFQGDIDWEKVKAGGVEFAIIRVGYRGYGSGEIVEDEKAKQNLEGATKAGIKVGVYFYSQAITVEEGIEEADFVLKLIKDYDITYPVVFDTEPVSEGVSRMDDLTGDEISDIAVEFCKRIENKGYKPMIYANLRWFLLTLNCDKLEGYDKWFAGYDKTLYFPYEIKMWQYSETGYVDGIDTQVDLDICFSDYE